MVAIQFTDRFLGVKPEGREGRQLVYELRPKLLCVPAAAVEVAGKLVQVAADPAALSQQAGENVQRVLSAAGNDNGLLDRLAMQRLAYEG